MASVSVRFLSLSAVVYVAMIFYFNLAGVALKLRFLITSFKKKYNKIDVFCNFLRDASG